MNGLELLKQDHRKVEDLFAKVEATDDSQQHEKLFQQIKTELETHTYIEETVLYPALKKHEELKALTLEAEEEHRQVKTLLREAEQFSGSSDRFAAKLKVLQEDIEHHVKEEETEMFPQVEQLYSRAELEQLGANLNAAKQQFGKPPQKHASAR